jgi:NAD(P)-dependent dehydrogenase (short-subunit alcohol dehydrogenase family)
MKDRYLLLTGGTGGLGSSVTKLAFSRGAHITIPYHSLNEIQRFRLTEDKEHADRIHFVFADLRDDKSVKEVFSKLDKLDILIHLVGGFSMGNTADYKLDDWKRQIDLNLTTTFLVCKYALQKMTENNYGRIVTVSSRSALRPGAGQAAYSAAKAGVLAFTQSLAEETKGTKVTANTVLPSIIDTEANREAMGSKESHKWVKPESLAEIICFLASEAAGDLRGAAIPVYGNV